ncbi:Hypothetical predicted protein [Cloeon dipterum]|uniref:Bacterial surface antigen (D15) domain-containing protein n=2 Tax=Cloeon dipterum TaxID=197152 RepID=A0A8S1CJX9_9INSE|nr:Hypothetical predicted protein [Cloeon dipterum]
MGTVQAKEKQTMVRVPVEQAPVLDFKKDVRVDRVNVTGLKRTKDDFIKPIVRELFHATNFGDVLVKADKVHRRLENLECFKNIEIFVDTSKGPKASPDGIEVTFDVTEMNWLLGSVNAMAGSEEAALVVGGRAPNILGRGEKVQLEYTHSNTHNTNMALSVSKPLVNMKSNAKIKSSIYQSNASFGASGFNEQDRAANIAFEFNSAPNVHHTVLWEAVWRYLDSTTRTVPMSVREQNGHSMKSSLIHSITMDRRNKPVFPSSGTLIDITTEFAGLGGDVGFVKNEIKMQANVSLFKDFVLQGTLQKGLLSEYSDNKTSHICDRFFLGGATSVRGFEFRGLGPHEDNISLGSELYWAAGLHLYAPLPFKVFERNFGDFFRTHLFVNAGNLGKFDSGMDYRDFFKQMVASARMSCGAGLAVRIGNSARFEINYCVPVSVQQGDRPIKGCQLGVGISFL